MLNIYPDILSHSFQILVNKNKLGVIVLNKHGQAIQMNQTICDLTGFSKNKLFKYNLKQAPSIQQHLCLHAYWKGKKLLPHLHLDKIEVLVEVFRVSHLEEFIDIEIIYSIKTKELQYDELWKKAHLDPLSKLANHYLLKQELNKQIKKKQVCAFFYLDLDGFKEINDIWSHDIGDALIKSVAKRLNKPKPFIKLLGRLYGDEFGFIIIGPEQNYKELAQSILDIFKKPFIIKKHSIHISACIGISEYPKHAKNAKDLINNADEAMHLAKSLGENQISFYDPISHLKILNQTLLSQECKTALIKKQFEIFLQPIINCQTGRIQKAEALIRWHHPQKGLITSLKFLPLIQRNDLLIKLNNWVFQEVCRYLKKWQIAFPNLQISINTPALLFETPENIFEYWLNTLKKNHLSPKQIILEITENYFFKSNPYILNQLYQLKEQGLEIALDDFGSGYSSLELIKTIDVNIIKINHLFTKNCDKVLINQTLCKTIIDMAKALNIKVIAEDVETIDEFNTLKDLGADDIQGFFISEPLDKKAFENVLKSNY